MTTEEPTQPDEEWGRWRTAAVIVGYVLGPAALTVGSWWLWEVFIRMHP